MSRNIIYTGDQDPSFPAVVTNRFGGVIDLTGYTSVTFALRQAYDTVNKWESAAVIVDPPESGVIQYDLGVSDLLVTPGVYVGQWTLLDGTSRPQHVDAGEFEVREGY
jgi:hypothetical protein